MVKLYLRRSTQVSPVRFGRLWLKLCIAHRPTPTSHIFFVQRYLWVVGSSGADHLHHLALEGLWIFSFVWSRSAETVAIMPRVEWKSRSRSYGRQPIVGRQLVFRNNLEHAPTFFDRKGDTCGDTCVRSGSGAPQDESIISSMTSHSSFSEVTHKSTGAHAADALDEGLFIRTLFSSVSKLHCCDYTYSHDPTCYDYETNWQGHHPLAQNKWSSTDQDDLASTASASEQRLMHSWRRRRVQKHWRRRNSISI